MYKPLACPDGWYAVNCTDKCPDNMYGKFCGEACPSNCSTSCHHVHGCQGIFLFYR